MDTCYLLSIITIGAGFGGTRIRGLEAKASAQKSFNKNLQKNINATVSKSGCKSWYTSHSSKQFDTRKRNSIGRSNFMSRIRSTRICILLLLLVTASCRSEQAQIDSEVNESLTVPGLTSSVTMRIDTYGISHIEAQNTEDLFFAQGYNAARDRLWQIDYWRRSGLGEMAAVFGKDFLQRDRAARLMLFRGDMPAEWAAYGPGAKGAVTAFVKGINAYIAKADKNPKSLPLEFQTLDYKPARWHPEDIMRIRSHGVWQNLISEVERTFMICSGLSKQDRFRVKLEPDRTPVVPPGLDLCSLPETVLDDYLLAAYPQSFDSRQGGSNNWAVSGSRTASGRPILAGDPHRAYTVPSMRYAVHLKAPGIDIIGAGEPHAPGVATGHNGNVAFGFTIFPVDQEDLMVYEVAKQDASKYRYGNGWEAFKVIHESIAVKGQKNVDVALSFTRHGPVLHQDTRKAYALRSVAFEPGAAPYLGQLGVMSAVDVDAYDKALTRWGSPGEHHVFADTNGDIAWRSAAKTPIRDNYDGLLPVPGDGRYEWSGFRNVSELPGGKNPKQGWIATANNILDAENYPYSDRGLSYEWVGDARAARVSEVLAAMPKHTVADSLALQSDYTSMFARKMQALLSELKPDKGKAEKAHTMLMAWDASFGPDSGPAALFQIWYYGHLAPKLIEKVGGEVAEEIIMLPDERSVLAALSEPGEIYPGEAPIARRDQFLNETLSDAYRDMSLLFLFRSPEKWAWGDLLTARWKHLADPILSRPLRGRFELEPVRRGGDLTTPGMGIFNDKFDLLYGASWRMVVDVGEWDNSVFVNAPGQSGDPRNKHFSDLYSVWSRDGAVPLLYSKQAVAAATQKTIVLLPESAVGASQ
jgi:penicillin amidase